MLVNQRHRIAWWTRSFTDEGHIANTCRVQPSTSSRHTSKSIVTNANPAPQHVLSATAQQPSSAIAQAPSNWHEPLSTILWQGSESDARKRLPQGMSPPWKVMLLSDGSVTRHLQLLTDLPVQVKTCMGAQALKASVPLRIAWRCATWGLLQKACHQGWRQSLDPERSARCC
ncbi:TPA: hypothetical protein ACH3X2_007900 [Trebouxia sp. C0005]